MRKTLIITIVLTLGLLNSCVKDAPNWERTYQIKNNSGYDIILRGFQMFTGEGNFEDIDLFNEGIYIGDELRGRSLSNPYSDPNNTSPTSSYDFTRFIVVFDNERSIVHSFNLDENGNTVFSEPTNRNLLRGGNYMDIGNDFFEFVLTEEDYNNAEPCDGDCLD